MALRVLLADESATIKKVIQLALQDFSVEVKSVPVGLDVLPVARSFKPDVVFADVLLTKRNGYEICQDLKNDAELGQTPVILMWSGFMELDQGKVLSSRVDRTLEKPFDPEQLRAMVKELVPVLQTNLISSYLHFPDRPEFVENNSRPSESSQPSDQRPSPILASVKESLQSRGHQGQEPNAANDVLSNPDDEVEEFKHVPLPKNRQGSAANDLGRPFGGKEAKDSSDEWSQADLAKFRLNAGDHHDELALPEIDEDVNDSPIVWSSTGEEVSIHNFESPTPTNSRSKKTPDIEALTSQVSEAATGRFAAAVNDSLAVPSLDFERAEQILREQAREVLESVAWRILPDIAERIVREELQKLLKDSERLDEI